MIMAMKVAIRLYKTGFRQKLLYELSFNGTQHFANTDFFCPLCRLGRRQIHEIHTGENNNEQSNDGKYIYIFYIAECCQSCQSCRLPLHRDVPT